MNTATNSRGFVLHAATNRSQLPDWEIVARKATCNLGVRFDRRPGDALCVAPAPLLCRAPLAGRRAIAEALAGAA